MYKKVLPYSQHIYLLGNNYVFEVFLIVFLGDILHLIISVYQDTRHISLNQKYEEHHYSVFGEVKTAPTECKERCFQIMSSAYHHYNKKPHSVLMDHLRKRLAR